MTDQELCAALRQSPRDGDGCRGAERIEGLKARLTASEAREREYDEAIVELYRLAPASTFDPAQPLLSIEGIVRDIQKASEARVEEAFRAGFESCAHNVGRCESGSYLRINPDEALAAWRSQHAAFTVPGTISVTGKDATFTKCDGDHAAVVPCVDPECWNRDAPVVGGGDGCKDTIWRDVLPAPAGKPAHAEEPHHLEEPEADGHDHHHADDDLDGPVDGKLLDRPQQ